MKSKIVEVKSKLEKFEFFKDKDLNGHLDFLTGVIDRETIVDYLNFLVAKNKQFTLCISDIDNFKNINDTFGHSTGDKILQGVASVFRKAIGENGVVGRFGGDEFFVILEDIVDYRDVWEVCHNINVELNQFFIDEIGKMFLSATTGVARFPVDAQNIEELFDTADKALYRGKMKGRNCFIIYLPEKHNNIELMFTRDKKKSFSSVLASFYSFMSKSSDLEKQCSELMSQLCNSFMFDHVCVETEKETKFENIFKLSIQKKFKHIDVGCYEKSMDENGILCINNTNILRDVNQELYDEMKKQGLKSTLCVKISAGEKNFGMIRIDMTGTCRIWQQDEISYIQIIANTLGLLLFYQNKTL